MKNSEKNKRVWPKCEAKPSNKMLEKRRSWKRKPEINLGKPL
jgi:hypothetical protein